MKQLEGLPQRIDTMYQEIGAGLADARGLVCRVCGHQLPLTAQDAAWYTARGWPRHCGKEMRINKEAPESEAR